VGKRRGAAATTPDRCVKLPGSLVNLHGTAGSSGSDTDEEEEDEEGDDDDDAGGVELVQGDGDEAAVSALASDLITLSGRPTAQWTTLANLDAIKRRNKPIHPPKKPEHVPFFLPTVKALKPKFDVGAALAAGATGAGGEDAADARPGGKGAEDVFGGDGDDIFGNSEFGTLVVARNFSAASKLMSSMGPSGADVELRTLEGPRSRLGAAQYFTGKLAARRDFEIHQAQLDVFLKAHGRELAQDEGGAEVLHALLQAQDESWTALRDAFDSVLTLSSHFSGQV
jgi:U3 small nucleolar RNA-associated protein 21